MMNSPSLSPQSRALLREVAQAIIDSRYATPADQRDKRINDLRTGYVRLHGCDPTVRELAMLAGVSKSTVYKVLGPQWRCRRNKAEVTLD